MGKIMFFRKILCGAAFICCLAMFCGNVKADSIKLSGGDTVNLATEVSENIMYSEKIGQSASSWYKFKTPEYDSYLSIYAKELLKNTGGATISIYSDNLENLEYEKIKPSDSLSYNGINVTYKYKLNKNKWYYIEFYNGLTKDDKYRNSQVEFKLKFIKDSVGDTIDKSKNLTAGKSVTSSIEVDTDIDLYCFKPDKNGVYKYNIENTGGKGILKSCITDSKTGLYDLSTNLSNNKSYSCNVKLSKGKSYYIAIWGNNKCSYMISFDKSSSGNYIKSINLPKKAKQISNNKYYNINFKSKGDVFWYKFKSPGYKSNCMLELPYIPEIKNIKYTVSLYSDKLEMLDDLDIDKFSGNINLGKDLLNKNKWYYIKIKFQCNNKSNKNFKFKCNMQKYIDSISNNKKNAKSININKNYTSRIDDLSDIDWFKYTPEKSGNYIFKLKNTDRHGIVFYIVSKDNEMLSYDYCYINDPIKTTLNLRKNKDYYIGIKPQNQSGFGEMYKYTFSLNK